MAHVTCFRVSAPGVRLETAALRGRRRVAASKHYSVAVDLTTPLLILR